MLPLSSMPDLALVEDGEQVSLRGAGFNIDFGKTRGIITSYIVEGRSLIKAGPQENYYRAPTDADLLMGNPPANIHRWRAAGLDRLERRLRAFEVRQINKKIIEVRTHAWLCAAGKNTGIESEIVYRVYGNGEVVLDNKVLVDQQLPFIPRVGLELVLPGEYEQLAWYGRGPHENYIDRKKGAALGRYKSTVADQFTPYVYPSECGGKEDVRWLALTDRDGAGLMVIALDQLHVDALHYTIQDLEEARHLYALKPRQEVILHLDGWHMGVGGDDGWAAQVHQEFLIFPGKYRFALRLKPINPQGDPAALGRTQIEGVF